MNEWHGFQAKEGMNQKDATLIMRSQISRSPVDICTYTYVFEDYLRFLKTGKNA
jgi:hypothetical protein